MLSIVLLVLAVVSYVTAGRAWAYQPQDDDPPPKWLTMTQTMGPGKAFGAGAGLLLIGAKFWVLTLGAIASIGTADLSRAAAIGTFLLFVALAESVHLAILAGALLAPVRSASLLDAGAHWLERNNRFLVIVIGLIFGTWFAIKALHGLGWL